MTARVVADRATFEDASFEVTEFDEPVRGAVSALILSLMQIDKLHERVANELANHSVVVRPQLQASGVAVPMGIPGGVYVMEGPQSNPLNPHGLLTVDETTTKAHRKWQTMQLALANGARSALRTLFEVLESTPAELTEQADALWATAYRVTENRIAAALPVARIEDVSQ